MARRSSAPRFAAILTLGLAVAACGTLRAPSAVQARGGQAAAQASRARAQLDAVRALAHADYLSSPALEGRGTATAGDALADDYIEAEFKKAGLLTARQAFTGPFSGQARNVMALLPGTERADRYIVVGAHKDHLGKRGGTIYPGANDNAAGTAALLEIARVMAERTQSHGDRPRANILFIAFSGEELGLVGSTWYTRHPVAPSPEGDPVRVPLTKIAGMINLDCVAVGQPGTIGTDAADADRAARDEVAELAETRGMTPVFAPFVEPQGPGSAHAHADAAGRPLPPGASSDHAAFRRAGVRAVCYYAEPAMSKYLHTPQDTVPARDTVPKAPIDRFEVDNLVRIGAVALDTAYRWSNESTSAR